MMDNWMQADVDAHLAKFGPVPAAPMTAAKPSSEKDLQSALEVWLGLRGYRRLTPTAFQALAGPKSNLFPTRGFYGHWFESQRNAFMPDLMIVAWPNTRPALFLELKTGDHPKYQPGQKQAFNIGLWRVAFSEEGAHAIIEEWESEKWSVT